MNAELFHPAPMGLPVPIRPPRGSNEMLKNLERLDWTNLAKARNGEVLRAGALWLHGFLDESHSIAQGIPSAEGSYWHALMHRSEGDFSNSKYWYRRVGRHAIFPDLLAAVRQLKINSQSSTADLLESKGLGSISVRRRDGACCKYEDRGYGSASSHRAGGIQSPDGLLPGEGRLEWQPQFFDYFLQPAV